MTAVRITEYTDPGCPWAYSAEPYRRRLRWLYGDDIEWQARMVVLAESPADYLERGFTPDKQAAAFSAIAREHGMPIDTRERSRMAATRPACRAVVAARLHDSAVAEALLRGLRVHHFGGDALLDEPEMLELAATSAGLDPSTLTRWLDDPRVETELAADMAAARQPMQAARVLDHKLANWSGGRRYTCPSYEITRLADGVTISVPGFQPFAVYDVLLPTLSRAPTAVSRRPTSPKSFSPPGHRSPRARSPCWPTSTTPTHANDSVASRRSDTSAQMASGR